jgi:hypothetical protein
VPTWEHWARWEEAQTPGSANHAGVAAWRERTSDLVVDWRSKLMVAYELSPVVTGQLL